MIILCQVINVVIRPDQINLLLLGFTDPIFAQPKTNIYIYICTCKVATPYQISYNLALDHIQLAVQDKMAGHLLPEARSARVL